MEAVEERGTDVNFVGDAVLRGAGCVWVEPVYDGGLLGGVVCYTVAGMIEGVSQTVEWEEVELRLLNGSYLR